MDRFPPAALIEPAADDAATTLPAWLEFTGIRKRFGSFTALDGIDLGIRKGEFVCLLGPSGCGKTTLLRVLAGLEHQDAGRLTLGGRDIGRLPPAGRDYGIVFQSYALFPNLTVAANIAYGLRASREEQRRRTAELLVLVGLAGSASKYPSQLSGGQQQRVALARALATSPSLLLLDEPLSALDAQVREHLGGELRRLQRRLGVTTLMVTHDQHEALALADTIAVMNGGRVEQVGPPEAIYRTPASRFVADFVGHANWLPVVLGTGGKVSLCGQPLDVLPPATLPAGPAELFCRPEDVRVEPRWTTAGNALLAWVEGIDFLGGVTRATLSLAAAREIRLTAVLSPHDPALPALRLGQRVPLRLPPDRLRLFAARS